MSTVSIAIPVRNGGALLADTLAAVRRQSVAGVELVVLDSGSTDGSAELARRHGARVEAIAPEDFGHGSARNRLMELTGGDHVAFLTQDAVPASERWLAELLAGFELARDVALVCGPYRARPGAPVAVRRELTDWFAAMAPDGAPRLDRDRAPRGPGPATFFSDANAAVARWAWAAVPFPEVPYAEDQALALAMLRAGYAKAFVPAAVVVHSHDYGVRDQFRRSFDEWRGLREVHGWVEPAAPPRVLLAVQSQVRADLRTVRGTGLSATALAREGRRSLRHWTVRAAGAALGSRADRLSPALRRWCSLERRDTFQPSHEEPTRA